MNSLPEPAARVVAALEAAGHEAYLVGGCVRDLLLGRAPKDLDVATSARPEEVRRLFRRAVPTGERFGTLTVLDFGAPVEVTAFRAEGRYEDARRPSEVRFGVTLAEDLARRDFTVNAMALGRDGRLVDPFGGCRDLEARAIRCVGEPAARFGEDALRMLRAARLAAQLGFAVEPGTRAAMGACAPLVERVSAERVRDELVRTLLAPDHKAGFDLLLAAGLLARVAPEVAAMAGVGQGGHHAHDVYAHSLLTVADKDHAGLALAELLHDVGKPDTRAVVDGEVHFHRHEVVGAEKAAALLRRLRCDGDTVELVAVLVRNHLVYGLRRAGEGAYRRLIRRVGRERVPLLARLVRADVAAHGRMPAERAAEVEGILARLAELAARPEPLTVRELAIGGRDVMEALGIGPGPVVGRVLNRCLEAVLDDPSLNTRERLLPLVETCGREGAGAQEDRSAQPGGAADEGGAAHGR